MRETEERPIGNGAVALFRDDLYAYEEGTVTLEDWWRIRAEGEREGAMEGRTK